METPIEWLISKEARDKLNEQYPHRKIAKDDFKQKSYKDTMPKIEPSEELAVIMEKSPHHPKREPSC